jgi:H3 lysine-79-specific histone-lysine N-methyltransferase
MVEQIKIRAAMWGVNIGEMELEEGDMLKSRRVDELMPKADVVLVDNKVFEESCKSILITCLYSEAKRPVLSVNEALKPKFLDLKEGAIVISLAPFVPSLNARLTERNVSRHYSRYTLPTPTNQFQVDDIATIFEVTERQYHSGSVSWGNNGGSYYVHRVDREGYSKIREKFEARQSMTRTRRRSQR